MKTMIITPGQGLKRGEVSVSAYWNGTPMFSHNMTIDIYNELVVELRKDFLAPEDVDWVIEHLNQVEKSYFDQCRDKSTPGYTVDMREASTHLMMINDLVNNKKVIPDNDMFGLLIISKGGGPKGSNVTPKKKKRK
jgi:hypothetical protein